MCETPNENIALASGTSVTVWSKEGKLLNEHGKNMFKFAKSVAVRSTGNYAGKKYARFVAQV